MTYNGIENGFLHMAIQQLEPQYRRVYPNFKGIFDLGRGIKFLVITEGHNKGKLTVGQSIDNKLEPHPDIEPVDYICVMSYFLDKGKDMATAFRLYREHQTKTNET